MTLKEKKDKTSTLGFQFLSYIYMHFSVPHKQFNFLTQWQGVANGLIYAEKSQSLVVS